MEGLYINSADTGIVSSGPASEDIRLLARKGDMEIMTQRLTAGSIVWLVPAETDEMLEFFFVHSGELELETDGAPTRLTPGMSFYLTGLHREMLIRALRDACLVYVANRPVFQDTLDFELDHERLLRQIQEKDHRTYTHSLSVARYTIRLFEELSRTGPVSNLSVDDMVVAAMFHDIGKCFVPDEILKKRGPLTHGELWYIRRHPLDSARLLRPKYGDRVADIARDHHERLDGSGYPNGLTGDQISMEAKILAVADCFDAMTTERGYNRVMTPLEAAEELCSLTETMEPRVTALLLKLVCTGKFGPRPEGGGKT